MLDYTVTGKFTPEILYQRLLKFAKDNLDLIRTLPKTDLNRIHGNQLARSSSSPGANYLEAIEAESLRDFIHKLKICRKESRESKHWQTLVLYNNKKSVEVVSKCNILIQESEELNKIFSSSINTVQNKLKK